LYLPRKLKLASILLLVMGTLVAQSKPRINFDRLIAALPDLPWDFEMRYVIHNGLDTDMLRIYYDSRTDVVRWRPDNPGSLAEVCNSRLDDKTMRRLLELLRDKKFNDLPSDNEQLHRVAQTADATVSVRLGRIIVRKTDRNERDNPALKQIESYLDDLKTSVTADPQSRCEMQSVPAKP
jgi:hypothetical protein